MVGGWRVMAGQRGREGRLLERHAVRTLPRRCAALFVLWASAALLR